MRLAYYAGASTAAAAACLLKAFHERPNFYSATVYLSQSNACLLILTNLLLIGACGVVFALQRLLYGPLRPIEIEQLSEKAWYAVLDTLLAMPSLREDVGGWLLTMFVLLLAGKVWGWIGEGRVDILEQQPPANPRLFHARLANSLVFSVLFDIWMTRYCFQTVAADPRPGMMVIFTFEFAILTVFSTFTLCRYILSLIATAITKQQMTKAIEERKTEIRAERATAGQNEPQEGRPASHEDPIEVDENEVDVPGWEEKRRWLFGLEMTADFLKLLLYIVFFTVSITFNGLPMHIMRDVYMTFASFTKRLGDYVNYKKATSDMNARYPDATTEEIRGDACIVCREDMIAWQNPAEAGAEAAAGTRTRRDEGLRAKKLPCGHILHLRCLKAWLERQQVCPTCRRPVITQTLPAVNNGAANLPAAPNAAPAAGAPNNAPQQPANLNRARIFNLGPLRIGFLNGPANQMDNVLNQLRGGQPPQAQIGNAQAGNAQQGAANTHATFTPQPGQGPPEDRSRPSQAELVQVQQRMLRGLAQLSIETSQLNTIRLMAQEFERLTVLHNHNSGAVRLPTASHPASFQQGSASPRPGGFAVQGFADQNLTGHPSQQVGARHPSLPQGMTIPEGWTVMPLHRQLPTGQSQSGMPIPQQVVPNAAPAPVQTPVPSVPITNASPALQESTTSQNVPSSSSVTADASMNAGPTDDAGSPLFVPASSSQQVPATPDGPPTVSTANTELPSPRHPTTWSSGDWDFGATDQSTTSAQPTSAQSTAPGQHIDKGKGRAVEVEDAPDSETG